MNNKLLKKRLRTRIAMHRLFGFGASIVIIGALFKILHWEIGPITGAVVLGVGLITEAFIFAVSALNIGEIKEEHDEYVRKVKSVSSSNEREEGLSAKIDGLMREAKLDVTLMNRLANSIKELETTAKALVPVSNTISASNSYGDQLTKAARQLDQLNVAYSDQAKTVQGNSDFNKKIAHNAELLRIQMQNLAVNLETLNQVYGGMLNAMNKNK